MEIISESHILDWNPDHPLRTVAKGYRIRDRNVEDGYTLVFAHGIGSNKEQWEPTMKALYRLSIKSAKSPQIREMWAIDCPNHGQAAILNDELLMRGGYNNHAFSWEEYIKIFRLFLTRNPKFNLNNHRLIGIGHSMGAVCLSLTQTYPENPNFEALILCEPMMAPTDLPRDHPAFKGPEAMSVYTLKRRDIWSSREAAQDLRSKSAYAKWDNEAFNAYLDYGLRDLPTAFYPDKTEGVTLACAKVQEAATYRDSITSRRAYEFLPALYSRLPVHIIWGEQSDLLALEVKERVSDTQYGRKPASVQRVKNAGHLVPQTEPSGLAEAIYLALSGRTTGTSGRL
ncbi:hypothetical protein M422DRAFT_35456 [Sphaerobolus stellatus SS14]|uniref:AB hydrolase-1 domain-containing protein n=1 Tax=Sphaerobolus stellatus (strain SS14) TaxID=990650 RepID=A0A0C9V8B0_SPHS4|nr:hypothetical protein M422DRAFT_35456 [Sphaerobolus stellatus SS14]